MRYFQFSDGEQVLSESREGENDQYEDQNGLGDLKCAQSRR